MLNVVFVVLVVLSVLVAAFAGGMQALTAGIIDSAKAAVEIAIGLVGVMALFLGLMKVAEDGGLLRMLARAVGPALHRLFPSIPPDHPAMSAMLLNISCNMLGLGNAATPFGIRAMQELDTLNTEKGTATNAMVLFLAINTSGLALLPTGTIAIRAAAGSADPGGILFTSWFATGCATIAAIVAATLLSRLPVFARTAPPPPERVAGSGTADVEREIAALEKTDRPVGDPPRFGRWVAAGFALAFAAALVADQIHLDPGTGVIDRVQRVASWWVIPALVAGLTLFGWVRGVRVYESLVDGAKEGFQVAIRILPYLVAILVAVGMFRASGALGALVGTIDPVTSIVGMPGEALPMALIRPLSGSGAMGVMTEVLNNPAIGPDSLTGYLVSTIQGSTETTFYVLAVYCGAIGVTRVRHAVPSCLAADIAGILAAVFIVNLLFG